MSGTPTGSKKAVQKILEKNPNFYRDIGKKGGAKIGVLKGFAANPELARIAGARGGKISKSHKKVVK